MVPQQMVTRRVEQMTVAVHGYGGERRAVIEGAPLEAVRTRDGEEEQQAASDSTDMQYGVMETSVTDVGDKKSEKETAAVRAIRARLDDEMEGRDEDRAMRYVTTVRPAMRAERYERPALKEGRRRPEAEEGGEAATGTEATAASEVLGTEDGDAVNEDTATDEDTAADVLVSDELNDEMLAELGNMAKVRMVTKAAKKAAKLRRVERAKRRRAMDEVDRAIARLDEDSQTRRRRAVKAARVDLTQRRRQQEQGGPGECANVRLVQHPDSATTGAKQAKTMVNVTAYDGLPTAVMNVGNEMLEVKLDSGARYSIAGTDWMMRGERQRQRAPVDHVEGIGGFVLDVLGVWVFTMRNAFGQSVEVRACIVDGCTDEFLIGVDFMRQHKAKLDFERNEIRYQEKATTVVIPFRTDGVDGARVAAVRMTRRVRLARAALRTQSSPAYARFSFSAGAVELTVLVDKYALLRCLAPSSGQFRAKCPRAPHA